MQLKSIQLNGFKSFVDPTHIPVLSHMNAIVGPNGCGKSNIVDAIRWVTGEMSAKQLRGQSMSDVIFNGSTGRKPLGKASVELTFDNSDHRIAGEYAGFNEISIRREVIRDEQSNYFINGVPARRRDLVDLFLGTGLGPRSYAVIEQGMIAELIEAKPEELRTHLEEVAGISKYRERRRETETRMRHTQENLERLNDVRDELEKQLHHLERQAHAAEKYKILQTELRLLHAQLKALQWKNFENQLHDQKTQIDIQETHYESETARLRDCETQIEKSRLTLETLSDQKADIQKQFYTKSSDIARLEQQIQHKQEQTLQWGNELTQSESLRIELSEQGVASQAHIQVLTQEVATLKPNAQELQLALHAANAVLATVEQQMRGMQQEWDYFIERQAESNQQLEIAKNNGQHAEQQKLQLQDRLTQLELQLSPPLLTHLSDELLPLKKQSDALKNTAAMIQATLAQLSQKISEQRAEHQAAQQALLQAQGELQKYEAQQASLESLQKARLQDDATIARVWLKKQGLSHLTPLGKSLQVEEGWEYAVERLLGDFFDGVPVDSIDHWSAALPSLSQEHITLLQPEKKSSARLSQKTLRDVIVDCEFLPSGLASIYIVEDLSLALQLRAQLLPSESVITREGQWMGSNWICMNHADTREENFLLREKQLKALSVEIDACRHHCDELQHIQNNAKNILETTEAERDEKHRVFQHTTSAMTDIQAQFSAKQSRLETLSQQQQRLQSEMTQLKMQLQQCAQALLSAQESTRELTAVHQSAAKQRELILEKRADIEAELMNARADAQAKKQKADERHIRLTSCENQLQVLTQTLQANQKQLTQLNERRHLLQAELSNAHAPLAEWKETLQMALAERLDIENKLRAHEASLQEKQAQLRELELTRDRLSKLLMQLQEQLQRCKLDIQEMLVRQTTLTEQLSEMHCTLENVLSALPPDAEWSAWEQKILSLQAKIERLGAINLAAIDESKTLSERRVYMDQQVTDLVEALEVLQNAIKKIDRETKHLFQDTFDKVNHHFQKLFPRIFGGGQAALELTEQDLLTTGIMVRAQPPGKRNSTIHLLSGGEKTLTAIALMFAMFQLNAAPFCILDEVDAPLDDVNVGRYCQLVKEMSQEIQFLIISHNKLTIEIADHLMGVTMQEPGVSRIVSVDMQAAVEMVEA